MTVDDMRAALGLNNDLTESEVLAAYALLQASWTQNSADVAPVITLETAKGQLRLDPVNDDQDDAVDDAIADAIAWVERYCREPITHRNQRRAALLMLTAYFEDRAGGDIFVKAEASARGLLADFRKWTV